VRLSLLTRVFLANAAVLTIITALLLFSPIEISFPVTQTQAEILVAGLAVALVVNAIVLRSVVGPLRRLTDMMRSVEPLDPGRRLVIPRADVDVRSLTAAFNDMLARLEDERRESARRALAAQEQERLRVSRELHDEVGQALTAVMLDLEHAARQEAPADGSQLAEAREAVRRTLDDVRRIARELRPEALDDLGLLSALHSLCTTVAAKPGLRVQREFQIEAVELSPEVELVIYRVAQESLTNVVRHSGASEVAVQLHAVDGGLRLTVRDDGRGLPAEGTRESSGIAGMRERALHVGGRLTITSKPDAGTEVRLDVPLPGGLA
jgi:two-component system sensor histidine kinase UhpB